MELTIGQRVDIFEIKRYPYGVLAFKVGSHYAEVAGSEYNGNDYGRDMIGNTKPGWNPDAKWHLNTGDMRKVGTMVIKKLK